MHRGRVRQQWDHTAATLCMLANIHRDSKKRRRPYEPADFHPFTRPKRAHGIPITKATIHALKVFC